jgi:hypothetical protein
MRELFMAFRKLFYSRVGPATVQGTQPAGPLDLASVTDFKSGGCPYASHRRVS